MRLRGGQPRAAEYGGRGPSGGARFDWLSSNDDYEVQRGAHDDARRVMIYGGRSARAQERQSNGSMDGSALKTLEKVFGLGNL